MLVNRMTFIAKRGHGPDVAALMAAEVKRTGTSNARVYLSDIGPNDTVAYEQEFESLEEYTRSWAEWAATPEAADFMEKFRELTVPGGANEIWTLVE